MSLEFGETETEGLPKEEEAEAERHRPAFSWAPRDEQEFARAAEGRWVPGWVAKLAGARKEPSPAQKREKTPQIAPSQGQGQLPNYARTERLLGGQESGGIASQ